MGEVQMMMHFSSMGRGISIIDGISFLSPSVKAGLSNVVMTKVNEKDGFVLLAFDAFGSQSWGGVFFVWGCCYPVSVSGKHDVLCASDSIKLSFRKLDM